MKPVIDKQQVRKLYIQGFTDSEVARKLNCKKDTIKKCIQRNFGSLKIKHQVALIRRREVLKAVNYQANRYMGDSTFVKKNRSIYKTKPNGDIILNKEVAPVVTWDTPKRLANEYKDRF
ncbi:DNA-binding response regulator [Clostridium sp. MT-14]|uniref:DNA-binding response regulator n=1 Tax=Clostridium aromativorans TaxID=2836848 RepID=A0ABS8NAW5_9CLOT|nr:MULTISPECIES: DNA-binding response regulator [Clostridium]KAA8668666.1 DNA-binding response regulator [Clostridium sp. HV4-5-A1G]MCC9296195.1 DNA-binding response regulator [Clostridium aromativorans]